MNHAPYEKFVRLTAVCSQLGDFMLGSCNLRRIWATACTAAIFSVALSYPTSPVTSLDELLTLSDDQLYNIFTQVRQSCLVACAQQPVSWWSRTAPAIKEANACQKVFECMHDSSAMRAYIETLALLSASIFTIEVSSRSGRRQDSSQQHARALHDLRWSAPYQCFLRPGISLAQGVSAERGGQSAEQLLQPPLVWKGEAPSNIAMLLGKRVAAL
jgi:hypothetical protein